MKPFLRWLHDAIDRLENHYGNEHQEHVEGYHSAFIKIADDAGQRALKVGLVDLHAESLSLTNAGDPQVVQAFLGRCVQAAMAKSPAKAVWLSVPEVAKVLKVEPGKVRAWIVQGELKASNGAKNPSGNVRWKISQTALDEFIQGRQHHSQPAPQRTKPRPSYEKII